MPVSRFTSAIVRRPAASVTRGLRQIDRGAPDVGALRQEHDDYVDALRAAGLVVTVLPPLEDYPDALFVEDPALVFTNGAILLRPGATSRRGEVGELKAALRRTFPTVIPIAEPGFVEGGDVLVTPQRVLVGLSARTDRAGADALVRCLQQLGQHGEIVQTPAGVLHFKTDCCLLDDETVFTTRRLAASGVFSGLKTVLVPDDEAPAANALRINEVVLMGSDYPRSIEFLDRLGYQVVPLRTTEIGKLDAGLSCMSLRWSSTADG